MMPGGAFCPRIRYLSGRICCRRALCPRMATVFGRKCPRGAERDTLSPKEVSFREEPSPGKHFVPKWQRFSGGNALGVRGEILLSPKEVSFREKPTPRGHIIPNWLRFSGGNALGVLREILLSSKEVSFREKPTPRGHFVPEWQQLPGENALPALREILLSPNGSSYRENSHPPRHLSGTPRQGDLHCWGNFFCGTDAFIEKNSYFWSNFTENILKHFLILMYFTVG